ncbi:hypothetical protein Syun_001969 [Stephania yunnanensis]|uniref:Glycosyltransferase 61 catalytic domain-containing protein n=1 Tax=Stephania yunnanensis TaxID=152371 RepID=A0AAP0LIW8_9MAGN
MMKQHQRYWLESKKGFEENEEKISSDHWGSNNNNNINSNGYCRKQRPKFLPIFLLFSLVCCVYLFAPHLLFPYSLISEQDGVVKVDSSRKASIFTSMPYGTLQCDRTEFRTDTCLMRGDIRTDSSSKSILLFSSNKTQKSWESEEEEIIQHERIKPYTRKWETSVMDTIDELDLIVKQKGGLSDKHHHSCQVNHSVPAIVFSNGGYTGNVYHEFNDGILPLYITAQQFNKRVVFIVLEYHKWWFTKYADILSRLSNYPPINFAADTRTHCFTEVIVGLRIHGELSIDSSLMPENKSIRDFRNVLDKAYWPRIKGLMKEEELVARSTSPPSPESLSIEEFKNGREDTTPRSPKLVILSRKGSRSIINEDELVELAEEIGFQVQVLRPDRTTELARIYMALNSSDAMVGVHGAAMTHFMFIRPSKVFIQIIPLGTDWAAETYYGEPAVKLGLKYMPYKILPKESSLYRDYEKNDPVLKDPESVNSKGWEFTKRVYLDRQMVRLNLRRFGRHLGKAYEYSISS